MHPLLSHSSYKLIQELGDYPNYTLDRLVLAELEPGCYLATYFEPIILAMYPEAKEIRLASDHPLYLEISKLALELDAHSVDPDRHCDEESDIIEAKVEQLNRLLMQAQG